MADSVTSEKKRAKKPNFTTDEELLIQSQVKENYSILNSKQTNTVTNKKKNKVWQSIADRTTALGVAIRTAKEVKDKWGNTKKVAKRAFSEHRKETNKTGGGPKPKAVSVAVANVIEMCKDSCSFKGIGGVETALTAYDENELECPEDTMEEELFESAHSQILEEESMSTAPASPVEETQMSPSILMPISMPTVNHEQRLPIISRPGTSNSRVQNARKDNKKGKISVEDVHRLQYEVLKKELVNQDLKKRKLNLQINILERLNQKSCQVDSPMFSQMWETMLN